MTMKLLEIFYRDLIAIDMQNQVYENEETCYFEVPYMMTLDLM